MKNAILPILIFLLFSCHSNKNKIEKDNNTFFVVDIANNLQNRDSLKLSSIADSVDFIPLETTSESLISEILDIQFVDNKIFVLSTVDFNAEIIIFSKSGKFLNKINKQGRGPREYYHIINFIANDKSIYIVDYAKRIVEYKSTGEFEKYIKMPKQSSRILCLGENIFACYIPDAFFNKKEESFSWIVIDSVGNQIKTIKTLSLDRWFKLGESISNHYVLLNFSSLHDNTYKETFNDTLYFFEQTSLTPKGYGYINLGTHKIDYKKTRKEILSSDHDLRVFRIVDINNYIFVYYTCKCVGKHLAVFDKKNGVFFNLSDNKSEEKIINDINGPNFKPFTVANKKYIIGYLEASECKDLSGFSKKIKIEEGSNPIIIKAKIKK